MSLPNDNISQMVQLFENKILQIKPQSLSQRQFGIYAIYIFICLSKYTYMYQSIKYINIPCFLKNT